MLLNNKDEFILLAISNVSDVWPSLHDKAYQNLQHGILSAIAMRFVQLEIAVLKVGIVKSA